MSLTLEDLRGEQVRYQFLNNEWRPAFIVNIYPDGIADLCVLVGGANGTYFASSVHFGKQGQQNTWNFRKIPEGIAKLLSRLTVEQKELIGEEETQESLFADEAKEPTTVSPEPADNQPVRRPAAKASRSR